MVVSWNEKPTPSPARMMRLDRQLPSATSRSVPVISAVVRTIMFQASSGQRDCDGLGENVESLGQFGRKSGQRRQQFDHLVGRTAGLHQRTAVEGGPADLSGQ